MNSDHLNENISSLLSDVESEYEEVRDAREEYGRQMAIAALGIALQELRSAVDSAKASA